MLSTFPVYRNEARIYYEFPDAKSQTNDSEGMILAVRVGFEHARRVSSL